MIDKIQGKLPYFVSTIVLGLVFHKTWILEDPNVSSLLKNTLLFFVFAVWITSLISFYQINKDRERYS